MSPEERADLWLNECCIYKPDLYRESLASAIRAAEDEALERVVDFIANRYARDFTVPWREDLAAKIRGLKSGPGVSGKDGR